MLLSSFETRPVFILPRPNPAKLLSPERSNGHDSSLLTKYPISKLIDSEKYYLLLLHNADKGQVNHLKTRAAGPVLRARCGPGGPGRAWRPESDHRVVAPSHHHRGPSVALSGPAAATAAAHGASVCKAAVTVGSPESVTSDRHGTVALRSLVPSSDRIISRLMV